MYRVVYTVEAKATAEATAEALAPARRVQLERGLGKLALHPYHKASGSQGQQPRRHS